MMSAFIYSQSTLNRLFNNCTELYWYWIRSTWNIKGGLGSVKLTPHPSPSERTVLKKPTLIRLEIFMIKLKTTCRVRIIRTIFYHIIYRHDHILVYSIIYCCFISLCDTLNKWCTIFECYWSCNPMCCGDDITYY